MLVAAIFGNLPIRSPKPIAPQLCWGMSKRTPERLMVRDSAALLLVLRDSGPEQP